jgi:hypothetical protein
MLRTDFEVIIDLPITDTQKLVMLILLRFRNGRTGQCNPSKRLIAEKMGRCERLAYSTVQELKRAGYVGVRTLGGGSGRTTDYVLNLDGRAPRENPAAHFTEENPADSGTLQETLHETGQNPADSSSRNTNRELNTLNTLNTRGYPPRSEKRSSEGRSKFARAIANIDRLCAGGD